jgi:hypothetical protein
MCRTAKDANKRLDRKSYSIYRSNWFITCMLEVFDTLGPGERPNERANASIQSVDGSLRGLAQECFQRMEDQLDIPYSLPLKN